MDRHNLAYQTAKRLTEYLEESVGVVCASLGRKDIWQDVVVASRQSLSSMLRNGHKNESFNLVIIDEAHLVNPARGQYMDILAQLKGNYSSVRVLGVTATPFRLLQGNIFGKPKSLFDTIDYKISVAELTGQGYLCPVKFKLRESDLLRQLDLVEKASNGDLDEKQQAAILEQPSFIQGVYDVYSQYARDRKTAIFCLSISHAISVAETFERYGIPTWLVHSKLPAKEVRRRISQFSDYRGRSAIINCSILSIAIDIPSITCIILARRTLSGALFAQIVGRGSRIFSGKEDCLVLDLGGSSAIFGVDLDNLVITQAEEENSKPPIKICPICETAVGLQCKSCPDCGFKFPFSEADQSEIQTQIQDAGDPGRMVDAVLFVTESVSEVAYRYHLTRDKRIPTVEAAYRTGRGWLRQWLCPQHLRDTFPQKKAKWYWLSLGGKYPVPATVGEWISRASELKKPERVTLDDSGKYPVIRKVG